MNYSVEMIVRNRARNSALLAEAMTARAAGNHRLSLALIQLSIDEGDAAWKLLPNTSFSGETDADGSFSVTHTISGPYVVFATASRAVGSETERYVWKVDSEKISKPDRMFLNNANLSGE